MIKAQELRLNNWIYFVNHDDNEFPTRVTPEILTELTNGVDEDERRHNYSYQPILLTPELLGKILNCEKVKSREGIYRMGNLQLLCNTDGKALLYIHYDDGEYCYVREINYLHQLQNVAFIMSDIELEITL